MTQHLDLVAFVTAFVTDNGVEAIPELMGELERAKALLLARLLADGRATVSRDNPPADRLLTAQEVSERTHYSVDWFYRHKRDLPFYRPTGRKVLFSEAGLRKWMAAR
jgi:excisionase family DNA binding protein